MLREQLKHELLCEYNAENQMKDIVIVVKDQLGYIQSCVQSIFAHTKNFNLWLWDNASDEPTSNYLQCLSSHPNVFVHRNSQNDGFIIPNNQLVSRGMSPYVILLNSDTEVSEGWDQALLGYLQHHPETTIVGYMGGLLDEMGHVCEIGYGSDIDYVMGWCLCMRRVDVTHMGLFDSQLQFAYFEDSDLSLRATTTGRGLHALSLQYVYHVGNVTIGAVQDRQIHQAFNHNGSYFRQKWADYLSRGRIIAQQEHAK